ncbi:unnamed protein product, partial [Candidula unifasciata]
MGNNERQKGDDDDDGNCPVLDRLPEKLRHRLLPFQKEGVRFAVEKNGRCLIADEMGLGKTIQAISVAYFYKDEWPLLIVVPSSLKFCWIEELEKWLPDVLPHEINLVHSGGDVSGMSVCPITIITYGLLRLPSNNVIREALAARKFQVVICDESHYLKNSKTLSCKTVVPLIKSAKRRILLSGTPALARPVELYSQIDAVCPGQFGSYWQFTDRYCDACTVYFGKFKKRQVNGASNLTELQQKLQTMMIRREKSDVLTELPPKQRQRILFELKSSPLKKDILQMFAELKQKIRQGDGRMQTVFQAGLSMDELATLPQGVFQLISQLYRLSGEAKIGPVREYVEMLCEDDQLKFLVFAYHHDMMDGIQQTLSDRKVKFVRIDGNTKSFDRQACVNQFQSDPETRVAILSILAAGVGLTLTAAKLVVFAELYWTPGVMLQCEDRAHRIGQTCSLPVHYLVARDTMDEWVWSSVCRKTLVTSTTLTGTSRQLEHGEGESYQVQLLSNADAWKAEEDQSDVSVTQLIQSQRPHDQSSILEFFPSQQSPENIVTRKRKYKIVTQEETDSRTSTILLQWSDGGVENGESQVLYDGADDSDNSSLISDTSRCVPSDMLLEESSPSIWTFLGSDTQVKGSEVEDTAQVMGAEVKDTAQVKGSEVKDAAQVSDLLKDVEFKQMQAGNAQMQSKNKNQRMLYSDGASRLDLGNPMDTSQQLSIATSDQANPVDTSRQQSVATSPTCDNSGGLESLMSEVCNRHSCLREENQRMVDKAGSSQWSCNVCTFFNHPELPECEMCDTPKKKSASQRHRHLKGHDTKNISSQETGSVDTSAKNKPVSETRKCAASRLVHPEDYCRHVRSHSLACSQIPTSYESPVRNKTSPSKDRNADSSLWSQRAGRNQHSNKLTKPSSERLPCGNDEFTTIKVKPYPCSLVTSKGQTKADIDLKKKTGGSIQPSGCVDTDASSPELDTTLTTLEQARSPQQLREAGDVTGNTCSETSSLFEDSEDLLPRSDLKTVHNLSQSEPHEDSVLLADSKTTKSLLKFDNCLATSQKSVYQTDQIPDTLTSLIDGDPESKTDSLDYKLLLCAPLNVRFKPKPPASSVSAADDGGSTSQCRQLLSVCHADKENTNMAGDRAVYSVLKFTCSSHTGRIFVFDENEQFLQASFQPIDLELDNTDELPQVLQQPRHLRLLHKFVREWSSLTDTKKRLVAKRCQMFTSPLTAYDTVKTVHGSTQRHLNK